MSTCPFKYRLTQKSSLATIAKAVRALGYTMKIEKGGVSFQYWKEVPGSVHGKLYYDKFVLDENVHNWLNMELENNELLARDTPEQ